MNHLIIFSWRLWVLWWTNKLSFCWCSHDTYFPLMIVIMCSEELTTPSSDHAHCSPAHLPRVWPRLPSLNVWTIFSPDFPNALHTRNILVVRASSSSSQAIHQRFTPDCDLSLPYSRHGDIQNIEHEKHQVRVLDSGFRIRLETNYYSWLELLFPLENSA